MSQGVQEGPNVVFVTGASGFLGSFVVRDLLVGGFDDVRVLVRGDNARECESRLQSLWWDRLELRDAIGGKVKAVCGDVTADGLGLAPDVFAQLASIV